MLCIRQALEDCDSATPSGPRPIVFNNVRPEGFAFDRGSSPYFQLGFDVPERVWKQHKKDLVSVSDTAVIGADVALLLLVFCML